MANRTVLLIRYSHIPDLGWKRGRPVTAKNGRIKPNWMYVNGVEVDAPNGQYQIQYYVGRKTVRKSVGNDLQAAVEILEAAQKKQQTENLANDLGIQMPGTTTLAKAGSRKTLAQLKTSFLDKYAHGSEDNVALYTAVAEGFMASCKHSYPEHIEEMDVVRYCRSLDEQGYADRTRSNRYGTLRTFLRHCGIDPNRLVDKTTHKRLKKYVKTEPEMYSGEQLDALINQSNPYLALTWEFLLKTGFRDEEAAFLEWSDIDFKNLTVSVRRKETLGFKPKDSEERTVPLEPRLANKLLAWRKSHPNTRFVLGTKNDRPNIKWLPALKRAARRAGSNCGVCETCVAKNECERYFLHKFRATYISKMLVSLHGDLKAVMRLSGHSDVESVSRYLCNAACQTAQEAVKAAFAT